MQRLGVTEDELEVRIPLRNRAGEVVRWAIVDPEDAELAELYRWHFRPGLPADRGYAVRTTSRHNGPQRARGLHTDVLERMGHPPGSYEACDHRNRDPLDNRRANLHPGTHQDNADNRDLHAYGATVGRPRVLEEHPERACAECDRAYRPRRKTAAANSRFCSRLCQRRDAARRNREKISNG